MGGVAPERTSGRRRVEQEAWQISFRFGRDLRFRDSRHPPGRLGTFSLRVVSIEGEFAGDG